MMGYVVLLGFLLLIFASYMGVGWAFRFALRRSRERYSPATTRWTIVLCVMAGMGLAVLNLYSA